MDGFKDSPFGPTERFQVAPADAVTYVPNSISLRDYFAGQAIVIMLRNWDGVSDEEKIRQWGISSYSVADSMLAAREKK